MHKFYSIHLKLLIDHKDLGNLKEAEVYTRNAILLKTDYAIAYNNLASILNDIGSLEEAFGISMETDDIIDFSSYNKGLEILKKYKVDI